MDRRQFLCTLGGALGAVALAPVLPLVAQPPIHPKFMSVDIVITAEEIARLNAVTYAFLSDSSLVSQRAASSYRKRAILAAYQYRKLTGEHQSDPL